MDGQQAPPQFNGIGNGYETGGHYQQQEGETAYNGPPVVAQFYREDASFPYDLSTTSFAFFEDKRFEYVNTERGCDSGFWWDYYTRVEGTWVEEETADRHAILLELTGVERSGGDLEASPDPKTFWAADGKILKVLTPGPLSPQSTVEWSHLKFFGEQPPALQS